MLILLAFIIIFHITSAAFLFVATIDSVSVAPRDFHLRFWISAWGKEGEGGGERGTFRDAAGSCDMTEPSLPQHDSSMEFSFLTLCSPVYRLEMVIWNLLSDDILMIARINSFKRGLTRFTEDVCQRLLAIVSGGGPPHPEAVNL